ncbi:MAG: endonuclease domain-containing protein [Methyloceanibacter sp.]
MTNTRVTPELREKARSLRHRLTKAEVLLWLELRELKRDGLRFRKQAPIGPYIVDFACLGQKLVVEVDGDLHETESGLRHDRNRDAYLRGLGYEVLRFDHPHVMSNAWHIAQVVRGVALARGVPTRPLAAASPPRGHPPLKGEG